MTTARDVSARDGFDGGIDKDKAQARRRVAGQIVKRNREQDKPGRLCCNVCGGGGRDLRLWRVGTAAIYSWREAFVLPNIFWALGETRRCAVRVLTAFPSVMYMKMLL